MPAKKIALFALFISLSAVGGMIKIPLGVTSIAMDSMPALAAVLFFSATGAGVVAALGHLISAMLGGFPLGPFHILIALEMFAALWLFAKMHQWGWRRGKWLLFIALNGIAAAIPFYFLLSPAFFYATVPGLLIASMLNAAAAGAIMPVLSGLKEKVLL
jgi:uncharacterized membrane protein